MEVLSLSFDSPLLALEASTTAGSVALWAHGRLVAHETVVMGAGQDDRLFPAIERVLQHGALAPRALRAIVCGAGPGSFTSLRIAAALAKGLARGSDAPLYAVPSLLVAAASLDAQAVNTESTLLAVHADALRGERYVLPVERRANGTVAAVGPLARTTAADLEQRVPASQRVGVLASPLADDLAIVVPDMRFLPQAVGSWREGPVALDAWEPEYGRLAEAQVKWEAQHGMPLPDTPAIRG